MRAFPDQSEHATIEQPDTGRTPRRLFIGGIAASIAALFANEAGAEQKVHRMNEWMRKHPTDIPGIKDVRILVEHPRPKKVIRRINEEHWGFNLNQKTMDRVIACQKQINGGVIHLQKTRYHMDHLLQENQIYGNDFEDYAERFGLNIKNPIDTEQEIAEWGAALALGLKDDLKLIGIEDEEVLMKLDKALEREDLPSDETLYIKFHVRNWILLQTVQKQKQEYVNVGLGVAHDLEATVLQWNHVFPDEAYSLMELTPEAIEQEYFQQDKIPPELVIPGMREYTAKRILEERKKLAKSRISPQSPR